ncbi:MAG: CPBP family intramembrane metalloprotease [Nitrospinae bacterium]|nr:CPBP family intramembrane metalloprotease [Nitrospinota bacterium]
MRPILCAVCLLFLLAFPARADEMPTGWLLFPGGTYLHEGDYKTGLSFAVPEIALLTIGITNSDRQGKQGDTPEINLPLLFSFQLYAVDKWSYYQKEMLRIKDEHPGVDVGVDPAPLKELMLAPFDPDTMSSPLVIAFALLGAADGLYGYPHNGRRFGEISSATAMRNGMSRDTGTAYYEGMAFAASYGAGLSEELIFRGTMLPLMDYHYGQRTGLISSSLTFGLLHSFNQGTQNREYLVAQATVAGFLFGWQVQEDDYRLKKAIAAHFWYDFVSMTATWFANPAENPLGIQVAFGF